MTSTLAPTDAKPAADRHPAIVYLLNLSATNSRRNMKRYLSQIANGLLTGQWQPPARADFADAAAYRAALRRYHEAILTFEWAALRFQHTQAVRAYLMAAYAPATANVMLSALRGVLKTAWRLGLMSADDYRAAADVRGVGGETLPAGRDLQQGEILALAAACDQDVTPAGARDAAVIALLYTCALRRAELAALDLADVDIAEGAVVVRSGKGRKGRTVYASNGALEALRDWIAVRGSEPGPLFVPINKGGRVTLSRMSAQAVYNLLRKRAQQAGVNDFSPHDFRRTFAGDMLDRGVDIVTIQKLMGHADVRTTARYDRRGETAKREAASKLHFPYRRRAQQR